MPLGQECNWQRRLAWGLGLGLREGWAPRQRGITVWESSTLLQCTAASSTEGAHLLWGTLTVQHSTELYCGAWSSHLRSSACHSPHQKVHLSSERAPCPALTRLKPAAQDRLVPGPLAQCQPGGVMHKSDGCTCVSELKSTSPAGSDWQCPSLSWL